MTSKQTKRQGVKLGGLAELVQVYLVSGETGKAPLVSAVRGQVQSQCPRNADIATSSEVCLGHLLPESEPEWSEVVPSVCMATWRGPRRGGRRPAGCAGPPASPPQPWRSHRVPGRRALPIWVQSQAEPCFRVLSLCALIAVRGTALALTSVCVAGLPWPRAGDVATSGRSGRRVWAPPSPVAQERVRPGSAWPFPRWSRDVDGLHPGRVQGGRRRPPHVSEGDAMVPSLTQPPVFLPLLLSSR